MPQATRRAFIGASLAAGAAAACAPAAAPPQERATTGTSEGDREWNELIAAAKKEGMLVLQTSVGEHFRKGIEEFEKAFPGITTEHTNLALANFRPRILQERQAAIYNFDVFCSTFGPIGVELAANGVAEPFRSAIVRKELMEDRFWRDTFEAGFPDTEKKWAFGTTRSAERRLWINTDMVKEGEIKEVRDLMNPGRWKGKIISADLKNMGSGSYPASNVRRVFGEDGIKRIWKDNEAVLFRDARVGTEAMVRGQYAVGIGIDERILKLEFLANGLGKQLKPVLVDNFDTITYSDVLWYVNRAPHPNAAKLFINWMLTKEGQTAWTKQVETNSRRVDVEPVNPDWEPDPKRKYGTFQGPDLDYDLDTRKIAVDIMK